MSVLDEGHERRRHLGAALRALRRAAKLTGPQLAERLGVAQASVSRIETGRQRISPELLDRWAAACAADAAQHQRLDALAEQAAVEAVSWRRRSLREMQREVGDVEATSGLIREYHPLLVPGMLQVPGYARAVYQARAELFGFSPREVEASVDARMTRQGLLHTPGHRFEYLITEGGLRWSPGTVETRAAQLDRLLLATRMPNVWLGVLPTLAGQTTWRWGSFAMFLERADDADPLVHVESLTGGLNIRDPADVARYGDVWNRLAAGAWVGDVAAALLVELQAEL